MKMKILKKILVLILLVVLVNILVPLKVNAVSDMFQAADDFLSKGRSPTTVIDEAKVKTTSNTIYKWLMTIAICVAVIIGAVLGVQFVMSSVEGKAKIQEALVPYIIGCMVVFGSFFIWKTLVNVGNSLERDTIDSAEKASLVRVDIEDGKTNPSELSETELKNIWAPVEDEINNAVRGTKWRHPNGTEGVDLKTAINKLNSSYKKIYDACNAKGMIETYKTTERIDLAGTKKELEFVRLKK